MIRPRRPAPLLAVIALAGCVPAPPVVDEAETEVVARDGITLDERIEPYAVTASSVAELVDEMRAHGPVDGGEHLDAATHWEMRWTFTTESTPAGICALTQLRVSLRIETTLPLWLDESKADLALRAKWARYLAALQRHERGHRNLEVAVGNRLVEALSAVPPAATCAALDREIDARGNRIVDQGNREQANYDARTGHGTRQGAALGA